MKIMAAAAHPRPLTLNILPKTNPNPTAPSCFIDPSQIHKFDRSALILGRFVFRSMVETTPRRPPEIFENTHDFTDEVHAEIHDDTYAETFADIHAEIHDSGFVLDAASQPVSQAITATQADVQQGIDPRLSAKLVAIRVLAQAEVQVEVQELKTKINALQSSLRMVMATGILINVFNTTALILGEYRGHYLSPFISAFTCVALSLSVFRMFLIPKRVS